MKSQFELYGYAGAWHVASYPDGMLVLHTERLATKKEAVRVMRELRAQEAWEGGRL
jgi:hypothetical protein